MRASTTQSTVSNVASELFTEILLSSRIQENRRYRLDSGWSYLGHETPVFADEGSKFHSIFHYSMLRGWKPAVDRLRDTFHRNRRYMERVLRRRISGSRKIREPEVSWPQSRTRTVTPGSRSKQECQPSATGNVPATGKLLADLQSPQSGPPADPTHDRTSATFWHHFCPSRKPPLQFVFIGRDTVELKFMDKTRGHEFGDCARQAVRPFFFGIGMDVLVNQARGRPHNTGSQKA